MGAIRINDIGPHWISWPTIEQLIFMIDRLDEASFELDVCIARERAVRIARSMFSGII